MKKIIAIILVLLTLCGCVETETFQPRRVENIKVIMTLPNGETIEGCPDWYKLCPNGTAVAKVCIYGVQYTTGLSNIAIIETASEREEQP